jgi:hypothetical protein
MGFCLSTLHLGLTLGQEEGAGSPPRSNRVDNESKVGPSPAVSDPTSYFLVTLTDQIPVVGRPLPVGIEYSRTRVDHCVGMTGRRCFLG